MGYNYKDTGLWLITYVDVGIKSTLAAGHFWTKKIDIHFVKNNEDPTGLGEPLFSPVFAAVANALYKATGKRFYDQPFAKQIKPSEVIG